MIRSRVFIVLAISLFLAGCLCAEAAPADNSKEKAVQDVKTLKELTAGVLRTAESNSREADRTKSTVESQNTKAVNAESDAKRAAAEITADKRKAEAAGVAQKATQELVNCNKLYKDAKDKAEQASVSLTQFRTRARDLNNKAQNELPAALSKPENYPKVIQDAEAAKTQTTTLSGDIKESKDLDTAKLALSLLRDGAKKVQALKYQAESLVIVSNIETKMSEAETDIQSIQRKKNEIDAIVTEMNQKLQSASGTSMSVLSSLCNRADSQLRIATNKVQEANKCNTDIQGKKTQLDQDLGTLMATDDESTANTQATTVKWQEGLINSEIEKIKAALGAADNALTSAKLVQKQMQDEMSPKKSQSSSGLNNEKQQDNVRTAEVTTPIQNGAAKNPAITETDQTALGKSKDTMDKASEQPVNANLDKTEQNKSTQLTDQQKQNPKDDKSELLNNDKLRNITKDITNNPLIGGEVPTRSAANDSAVTVFIPLLVILVISAVLH